MVPSKCNGTVPLKMYKSWLQCDCDRNQTFTEAAIFVSDVFDLESVVRSDFTSDLEHAQQSATREVPKNYSAILDELDLQMCVAHDICRFFSCLTQYIVPIVAASVNILEHGNYFAPYIKHILQIFSHRSPPNVAITAMYETIVSLETSLSEDCRLISDYIPCVSHLHAVLKAVRADRLHEERSRRSIIYLNDSHFQLRLAVATNTTGTFRCPLVLLRQQLDQP